MRPPVAEAIAGAERTVLAAGVLGEEGLENFSRAKFAQEKIGWDRFLARALANAAADLAGLKPRYERNKNKVIKFAALESNRPLVASAVLAPGFLDLFGDTLGERVLLVVPSRFTAYVFPALASDYRDYWPMVFEAYRATAFPVSVEVFEVSAAGLRAVGIYEEP